jgi:hypothetical protein
MRRSSRWNSEKDGRVLSISQEYEEAIGEGDLTPRPHVDKGELAEAG